MLGVDPRPQLKQGCASFVGASATAVEPDTAEMPRATIAGVPHRAVLLDFYGTLARATHWVGMEAVLADHGYQLPERLRERYWAGELDGIEHVEHSRSRDDYVAWQQERVLGMLAECDVHPAEYDLILEELHAGNSARVLEAYPEVTTTLAALRARGLVLAVCSNWDWDLEPCVGQVGLTDQLDVLVSSAWVGARKPHPRIFRHTLAALGIGPEEAVFVGDTWGPDVAGPRACGMEAVYLERVGHWPDATVPEHGRDGVTVIAELSGLQELL
jgi:putative hydrolase of the HAD superfamily